MKNSIAVFPLLFILTLPSLLMVVSAQPLPGPHIQDFSVLDQSERNLSGKTLQVGQVYQSWFKLIINVTRAGGELILETNFERTGDAFWQLVNPRDFAGIDTSTWTPGSRSIRVKEVAGVAQIGVRGRVPINLTVETLTPDLSRHFLKNFTIVQLRIAGAPGSGVLDAKIVEVTDPVIQKYDELLAARKNLIGSTSTDPVFASVYNRLIALAQDFKKKGNVNGSIDVLNTLPAAAAGLPVAPTNDTTPFIAGLGGAAVVIVALGFMWVRSRSKVYYLNSKVDDQARKLDLTLVRLNKIDKSLADEITQIKEELKRASGGG